MHLYRGPVTGFSPHSAHTMLGCQPAASQPPVNTRNLVIRDVLGGYLASALYRLPYGDVLGGYLASALYGLTYGRR